MPDRATGVETATGRGGLALTIHGAWRSPSREESKDVDFPAAWSERRTLEPRRRSTRVAHGFRSAMHSPQVYPAEMAYRLTAGLPDALIWTGSRYKPFAVGGAGAAGLAQLMSGIAREPVVSNRFSPRKSVWASARYLRQLLDKFSLVELTVAASNADPGAVVRAKGIPLYGETHS